MVEKHIGFPNAAGVPCPVNDPVLERELYEAGIEAFRSPVPSRGEVKTRIIGGLGPWSFTRAWRYWVAKGPGLPLDRAERLHADFGNEARVNGDCTCPSPRDRYKGFPVPLYHVDTGEGLRALADALRGVLADA